MRGHISYCVNSFLSAARRPNATIQVSSKGDSKLSSVVGMILLMCLNYVIPRRNKELHSFSSSVFFSPLCSFFFSFFQFLSLHLQESNLWRGRKYTLYWSRALELPDLISLVDVVDWGKNNCGLRLDLFFSMCSNPWHITHQSTVFSRTGRILLAPGVGRQNFSESGQTIPAGLSVLSVSLTTSPAHPWRKH